VLGPIAHFYLTTASFYTFTTGSKSNESRYTVVWATNLCRATWIMHSCQWRRQLGLFF